MAATHIASRKGEIPHIARQPERFDVGDRLLSAYAAIFERLPPLVALEVQKVRTDETAELQRSLTAKEWECVRLQHELKLEQIEKSRRVGISIAVEGVTLSLPRVC